MKLSIKDYILVLLQAVLFVMFLFDFNWLDVTIPEWIKNVAIVFFGLGLLITMVALLQLNKNLSPFPTPKSNSALIKNGLYKYIRHPIYTGLLFLFFGYTVYSESIYRLIVSILLLALFHVKSRYEEQKLKERFVEYESYRTNTGRFLPRF
ncbi:isoprenylcysteine carboxylmethyltransferase family protein [Paucihalobacter ruber]|uniref:Isoprenylcysteine carboxylmethyltransferase family protein n=1 Tax=Paucihalobacter ruber TaxID=2567861 RepID=A0A506PEG6_9FLAO|nr:isoprenylcysteine carboxylmethyltransferase family protein [Paucihalobacter ruber]TPV31898.1 isoprenylcysteine carboxylmethyltransferase family protein [Paucihalobacter ruber]